MHGIFKVPQSGYLLFYLKSKETKQYKAVQSSTKLSRSYAMFVPQLSQVPKEGAYMLFHWKNCIIDPYMMSQLIHLKSRGTKLYKEGQIVQKMCKFSTKTIRRVSDWLGRIYDLIACSTTFFHLLPCSASLNKMEFLLQQLTNVLQK